MPDSTTWSLFLAAGFVLLVTPGPAVLYIVARSVHQGRRAGLVSCLGLTTGGLVHVGAAVAGLSAILVTSGLAFRVVQLAGAAYLVVLGIQTLRNRRGGGIEETEDARDLWRVYRDGFLVNLFNPKAALFFFAFLPQFVDPDRGSAAGQILWLGLSFLLLGLATDTAYALASGSAGAWIRRNPRLLRGQRYVSGTVYLGLGVAAALGGRPGR